jgi:dolichyl-phosphate-mannose--protein O-mannosyl transferase
VDFSIAVVHAGGLNVVAAVVTVHHDKVAPLDDALTVLTAPVRWITSRIPYRFELLLFVLSAATRYYHSDTPGAVVFDETHFGGFVGSYHEGRYFFDIHPPLGKLSLLWLGYLFGYDPAACSYKGILSVYAGECQFYILRRIAGVWRSNRNSLPVACLVCRVLPRSCFHRACHAQPICLID